MSRKIDSDSQIGRRLRLRDLHLFFTVVQRGSMAKAASHLGISQPAVSEVIADLEHTLGVRLFDRRPQGVEPTVYGRALLRRGLAAFDELKQGIRDIEFLSDPTRGELRIGCAAAPAATTMPPIVQRFSQRYPRVVLHVDEVPPPRQELTGLHERRYDLIMGRWTAPAPREAAQGDVNVEFLLDDPFVIAAGTHTRWARRRKIDPAELIDERWILSPPTTWSYQVLAEAFRTRDLNMPNASLVSVSAHVRTHLMANGPFLAVVPKSLADRYGLKVMPVDLAMQKYPIVIITLKNRTLTPVVQLFIDCAREVAKNLESAAARRGARPQA
jgi:DNA-binding transcriptional LysR family regulator